MNIQFPKLISHALPLSIIVVDHMEIFSDEYFIQINLVRVLLHCESIYCLKKFVIKVYNL